MIKIKEAIIVEGKYDKIRLSSIVDTVIIETNGFRIFKDKEKQKLIQKIAKENGILILTDSDSAGFLIRNFLKSSVPKEKIKNAYIPQLSGKEKRKEKLSKEGFLGVEGVDNEIIIQRIRESGVEISGEKVLEKKAEFQKKDLYELGLTGKENSKILREKLLKFLQMPTYLSTNSLLTLLNCFYTYEQLEKLLSELK